MRENHKLNREVQSYQIFQKQECQAKSVRWTWTLACAVFGFVSGFATLIFGEVLTAVAWLMKPEVSGAWLLRFGTALCLLTIPLLGFGAHCLDLLDKKFHPPAPPTNFPPGYAAPAGRPLNKKRSGHLKDRNKRQPDDDLVTGVMPEFVPARWWHQLLHNQSSLLLKGSLLFKKGVIVTSVPYHLQR